MVGQVSLLHLIFKDPMATDSHPRATVESLENGLLTLRANSRKTGIDGDRHLLTAFSLVFACAMNAIQEEFAKHDSYNITPESGLFRLAQKQGLVQSQSRWETYRRLHEIIEDDNHPDFAATIARYLPAFTLDVEMLGISIRNKHRSADSAHSPME
ncbi:hypothetical protein [Planctomicrobium sp. SH527]|uniref:hypothetical protein n=1 Tax=Planctomicrobium sp. SH527 TaxID=3448123 RepID=UPI003F5B4D5F